MPGHVLRLDQLELVRDNFRLETGVFLLGRSSECDFVVNHPTISRRHATIVVAGDYIAVSDLGSLNGTFIDEVPIGRRTVIVQGQRLRFGSVAYLLAADSPHGETLDSDIETDLCDAKESRLLSTKVSRAQNRVLDQLLQGLGEKQIAVRLSISQHTVHNHVKALLRCFGVHSRSELLALFVRRAGDPTIQDTEADRRIRGTGKGRPD